MSGFQKRSKLTPSSPGKSGDPAKGTPEKSAQQSSGQQKAPNKKLQWSMNDLLTKLDSGDAQAESVQEAMAQARAGDTIQQAAPAPPPIDNSVKTTEEPAFHQLERPDFDPAPPPRSSNGEDLSPQQRTAEDHITYEDRSNIIESQTQATPEQFAAEQSFSAFTTGDPTFRPPTEQQLAAEQSFSAFASGGAPANISGDPAMESFRKKLDEEYNAKASPAAAAAQAQFDAFTSHSDISFAMPDAEPLPLQKAIAENGFYTADFDQTAAVETRSNGWEVNTETPEAIAYVETPAYETEDATAYNPAAEAAMEYDGQSEAMGYHGEVQSGYDAQFQTPGYDVEVQSGYNAPVETPEYDGEVQSGYYAPVETPGYDGEVQSGYYAPVETPAYDGAVQSEYDAQSATPGYEGEVQSEYDAQSETPGYDVEVQPGYDAQSEASGFDPQLEIYYAENETTEYVSPETSGEQGATEEYYPAGDETQEFQPQIEGVFDQSGALEPAQPTDAVDDAPVSASLDPPEWMEPGVTAETPQLEWSEPISELPESQPALQLDAAPPKTDQIQVAADAQPRAPQAAEATAAQQELQTAMNGLMRGVDEKPRSFSAAANLLKKAAQKKTEILKDEPQPEPEPIDEDDQSSEEPYTFRRPELASPQKPLFEKTSSPSTLSDHFQYETGRINLKNEMTSVEAAAKSAAQQEWAPPPQQPAAASTDVPPPATPIDVPAPAAAPAAESVSPPTRAELLRPNSLDTGMIDMREMMSKIAPNFAAPSLPAPDAVPVSPPNQFKREQIPNIAKSAAPAKPVEQPESAQPSPPELPATSAPSPPATEGTAPATKPKKKKTGTAKSKTAEAPQADVIKSIQKMAPLSSMQAAQHQEMANNEVKLEHQNLVNQTNQIKNRMRSVPPAGKDTKLSRQAKIGMDDALAFLGRHQRHVAAAAAVGLLAIIVTLFTSIFSNGDLDQRIAEKMKQNHFEEARELVDKGLPQFPNDSKLHFFKGRLLAQQGQNEQALQEYMVATVAQPDNLEFVDYRARLYIDLHRYSDAITDYNRLLTSHDYAKAYNYAYRAQANLERGHFNEALADANKAIKMDPSKSDYYATRAWAYAGMKQYDRAIKEWSNLIAKDPNNATAYAERARAEKSSNQVKAALADLAQSLSIKPSGSAYYYRGLIYRDQNQLPQAINEFSEALKYDSRNPSYLEARAQGYAATGNFEQAVQNYDALAAVQSSGGSSPELLAARALAEMKAGKYGQAADDWEKVLAIKPNDPQAKLNHAESCLNSGEYTKAYDDLTALIEKDPKNAMLYVKRGVVSSKQNHYAIGAADFEKAISIDPNNPNSYFYRGMVSQDHGSLDQARMDFEHVLKLQPDNAQAREKYRALSQMHSRTTSPVPPTAAASLPPPRMAGSTGTARSGDPLADGYNQWRSGNLPVAIELFTRAAKKSPNNALARRYLAYALLQNGQASEASSQFKALATLGSLTGEDEERYMDALNKSGDQRGAIAMLSKKVSEQPDDAQMRMKLARILSDAGQTERARQLVAEGLKQTPRSPEDYQALKDLYNALH
jgi:tetratricopeptide (TPR) repeat protein